LLAVSIGVNLGPMHRRHVAVSALTLVLVAAAVAQEDRVDDFIKRQMQSQKIPGLSVVVVRDGKVVKAQGYGLANRSLKVTATAETIFRIGSISKQFIATGIMLLVQEGSLRVEDPITKYLKDAPSTWNGITIQHLLTHTSGLGREAPGYDRMKIQNDADVIRTAHPVPLRFAPGQKWEYSNLGYTVLADVIRSVAGRPWNEYLHEKVFKPSGMDTTHALNTTGRVPNRAVGYADNDKLQEVRDGLALHPAGGYLSTVLDLAKWDAVLYTNDVLSDSTRRRMWTPVTLNDGTSYPYGFGWELGTQRGRRVVHHGGETSGFLSEFARFVDDRLTVVVLMNLDDADVESLTYGIAAFYLPAPVPLGNR